MKYIDLHIAPNFTEYFFSTTDVNVACDFYNSTLLSGINVIAPLKYKTVSQRPYLPWFNACISAAKSVRRAAEDKWRKSGSVADKEFYRFCCNDVIYKIRNSVDAYMKDQIESCNGDQRKLFNTIDNILERKPQYLPIRDSQSDLANEFADFFYFKILGICEKLPPVDLTREEDLSFNRSCTFTDFNVCSVSDILKVISRSPKSSCGLDPFPSKLLVKHIDKFIEPITHCLNLSLSTGIFPDIFKTAHVRPLLKKSSLDQNILKNYRPVSNLPFLSKVLERVVAGQLQRYMDDNELHNPLQSAYRANHSCETALLKVSNDILQAMDSGHAVIHVMLDLSAAFDTLEHSLLLKRLSNIGISGTSLEWFKSYLCNRKQIVVIDGDTLSDPRELRVGVPQGSVLGPILFSIYTIPLYFLCCRNQTLAGFYADDSQIYIICKLKNILSASATIENCISEVQTWMSNNRLKLNGDKTELTVFSSPRLGKQLPPVQLSVGEDRIAPQTSCRNLGSFFDQHLAMDVHVTAVCQSSYFYLSKIASIRHLLNQSTTEALIHAFVSSRLDYCNGLLFGITKQNLSKLQKVQNKAARICLNVSRKSRISSMTLLKELHWLPISFRIDFKVLLLTYKCLNNMAPKYLSDLLHQRPNELSTRSASLDLLSIPKSRTKSFGDRSFAVAAPRLWNELPFPLRNSESVVGFKKDLKTRLFRLAFV